MNAQETVISCSYDSGIACSPIPSCLRSNKKNGGMTRNVSFPEDDSQIVTGILEPESPWKNVNDLTNDDLKSIYILSCDRHDTSVLPMILEQLSKLNLKADRNECLSLKRIPMDGNVCETLEEIFKRVQFHRIDLEDTCLSDESSVALFDMLEYYESATELNISNNRDIGVRGWQACSRLIRKTCCLESLEARNTPLNDVHMPILGKALKAGSHLQVLKLEKCKLAGRPMIILASALRANTNLKELYLSENELGVSDAYQLGSMLKSNVTLQLLDISHNSITDAGMNTLTDSIIDQCFGLCVLIVWNNRLTRNAGHSVRRLLDKFTGLEMLNIGMNVIGNDFLFTIKESLSTNRNLLKLGMQSTCLSNEAAFTLADILLRNTILQRIDLRDNEIHVTGLNAILKSLHQNRALLQMDLDRFPKKSTYTENADSIYKSVAEEIRKKCAENEIDKTGNQEEEDQLNELNKMYKQLKLSFTNTRKISLTCDTTVNPNLLQEPKKNGTRLKSPAPSPIPSPVSSPTPVRSRFKVSKVSSEHVKSPSNPLKGSSDSWKVGATSGGESVRKPGVGSSRFKIVVVADTSSDDEKEICKKIDEEKNSSSEDDKKIDERRSGNEFDGPVKANRSDDSRNRGNDQKFSRERKKSILATGGSNVFPNQQFLLDVSSSNNNSNLSAKVDGSVKPKNDSTTQGGTSSQLTDKIRKLSWVTSSVMDTNKIPANLEKLLGLFQNPFSSKNSTKSTEAEKENLNIFASNNNNNSKIGSELKNDNTSPKSDAVNEILVDSEKRDSDENNKIQNENNNNNLKIFDDTKYYGLINQNNGFDSDGKGFPATWPQKLTTSNILCSPTRSSPNILQATAIVLLQGQVSSDLTAAGMQNISDKTSDRI